LQTRYSGASRSAQRRDSSVHCRIGQRVAIVRYDRAPGQDRRDVLQDALDHRPRPEPLDPGDLDVHEGARRGPAQEQTDRLGQRRDERAALAGGSEALRLTDVQPPQVRQRQLADAPVDTRGAAQFVVMRRRSGLERPLDRQQGVFGIVKRVAAMGHQRRAWA
jgi:hypothetical protein